MYQSYVYYNGKANGSITVVDITKQIHEKSGNISLTLNKVSVDVVWERFAGIR